AEFARVFFGHVLRLGVAEAPNLVALNPLRLEIAKRAVLIALARRAKVHEQLEHRALRNVRHAGGRAYAVSFDQGRHYLRPSLATQPVHAPSMLDRSSIVKG